MSSTPTHQRILEVFFSYSHRDEQLRDELSSHLAILKRRNVISDWHDRRIAAGGEWEREIDEHLNRANLILLLVSSDFIASRYCYDIEVTRAMERHNAGEARVIPVILRAVDWTAAPFAKLKALPRDGVPVTSWPNRDEAFRNVAEGIKEGVDEIASEQIQFLFAKLDKAEGMGNWPNVIDIGERILEVLPDHQTTRSRLSLAHLYKWRRKLKGDVYRCAHAGSSSLLEAGDRIKNSELLLLEAGPDGAAFRRDLGAAHDLDPDNAEYFYWKSALDYARFSLGIDHLTQAIRLAPDNGKYHFVRSLLTSGEAAQRDFDRAVELGYEVAIEEKKRREAESDRRELFDYFRKWDRENP
jgi:hypothetical protein